MNQIPIHIVGRLIGDPDRAYRRDGIAATRITVEVQDHKLTSEGRMQPAIARLECRAVAQLAEHIYASLRAGNRVVVFGRLRQRRSTEAGGDYDLILDDLGASLLFDNVWPIPSGPDEVTAGIRADVDQASVDGGPSTPVAA